MNKRMGPYTVQLLDGRIQFTTLEKILAARGLHPRDMNGELLLINEDGFTMDKFKDGDVVTVEAVEKIVGRLSHPTYLVLVYLYFAANCITRIYQPIIIGVSLEILSEPRKKPIRSF